MGHPFQGGKERMPDTMPKINYIEKASLFSDEGRIADILELAEKFPGRNSRSPAYFFLHNALRNAFDHEKVDQLRALHDKILDLPICNGGDALTNLFLEAHAANYRAKTGNPAWMRKLPRAKIRVEQIKHDIKSELASLLGLTEG